MIANSMNIFLVRSIFLDARLPEKLKEEGFTDEQIAAISDGGDIDYVKIMKLAIDHSDAIVESSAGVLPELVEYAKASGKPFLPYQGEEPDVEAYKQVIAGR